MGGPRAGVAPDSSQESMESILSAYQKNLPSILSATGALTPELAGRELEAAQGTTGGYNQLALDQLQQYGLPIGQLAQNMQDQLNPGVAANAKAAGAKSLDLLNSINLNGLTPAERAETERSLNQSSYATGNLGLDNATNAVQNAMSYGDRLGQKRSDLAGAISTANGFMGSAQPTQFGMNASVNTGKAGDNSQALGFGQGMMGNMTSTQNAQNQLLSEDNWRNSRGYALSDAGKNASSVCCFIFLEATNGKLPWYVRAERDYYYQQEPAIATGYKKMAKWLVPLMRDHSWIKKLVNVFMVTPLTQVGGYDHLVNNKGYTLKPIKHVWFSIWRMYGCS